MRMIHAQVDDTVDRDVKLRLYHTVNIIVTFSFLLLVLYAAEPLFHRIVKAFLEKAFVNDTMLSTAIYEIYSMFSYACRFFLPLFLTLIVFRKNGISGRSAHPDIPFAMKLPSHPIASIFAVIGLLYVIGNLCSVSFFYLSKWGLPLAVSDGTLPESPISIFLYFLSSVILPAIVEELIFRGYLLHLLLPHGKTFAILVSGVLFGLMHFYLPQLLYASVAGVLIGFLVVQSGSIWCGIFLHIVNNLLVFIRGMASVLLDAHVYLFFSVIFEGLIYLCGMVGILVLFTSRSVVRKPSLYDASDGNVAYANAMPLASSFRYAFTLPLLAYLLCAVIATVQNSFVFS